MVANAVRKQNLRDAIANAIAENVKAYDVADVCVHLLGLDPPASAYDDPMSSKRVYVRSRLIHKSVEELEAIARTVIDEYGDDDLEQLVAQLGMTGVSGELKNLIFAANGPKPRIVLRDAINNVIEITENARYCLVYDQPLTGTEAGTRVARALTLKRQRPDDGLNISLLQPDDVPPVPDRHDLSTEFSAR